MFIFFKKNVSFILLILLIILFIIIKIPYLNLPYYWDEAWVYGPAIRIMEAGNISLSPDTLPVYYSRGHPLFFHFMGALWLRVFGTSLIVSHIYSLFISLALIISVYLFCKKLFSKKIGVIACLFLLLQPIFQAQSVLLLPEVMLSLFSLLTLFFFISEKWIGYVISATLALYTKETGIVAIATIGIWFLIETFFIKYENFKLKKFFIKSCILIMPLIFISIFFIFQKNINGWYFFPEHINYISNDSKIFANKLEGYSASLFIYWGRNIFSVAIIISLFLYFFFKKYKNNPFNKTLIVLSLFIVLFLIACSLNFYSDRYILSMVVIFVIITSCLIVSTFSKKIFLYLFVLLVFIVQVFVFLPKKN